MCMPKKPKAQAVAAPAATAQPIVLTDPKADQERIAQEARVQAGQQQTATNNRRRRSSLLATAGAGVDSNTTVLERIGSTPVVQPGARPVY